MTSLLSHDAIQALQKYTACDISDALLKLKVPGAGFLADLTSLRADHQPAAEPEPITIAPASTVLFTAKGAAATAAAPTPAATKTTAGEVKEEGASTTKQKGDGGLDGENTWSSSLPAPNIPTDAHWADLTPPGSIVVLRQPDGQRNAVCGGIMALRMKARGAQGVVVVGRARDVTELRATGLPIFTRGLSTVGSGAATVPWAVQVRLTVDETIIEPDDIVFADPVNGVVVIPRDKVNQVLELLPKLTAADDKVKAAVEGGMGVQEAFRLHRGKL